jgi:hypothetical protein
MTREVTCEKAVGNPTKFFLFNLDIDQIRFVHQLKIKSFKYISRIDKIKDVKIMS